jgi:hypothetical protein
MPLRRRRRPSWDVHDATLRLDSVAELFSAPVLDEWGGTGHLHSGIERVVGDLAGTLDVGHVRLTIEVPAEEIEDDTEERVRQGIARYCELRGEELRHDRAAQRRDGVGALAIGLPVLLACLVIGEALRATDIAGWLKSFFADGLFLVLAWVAVWYPLDMIFYYGRPLNRGRHVLHTLRDAEIIVRASETASS